MLYFLALIFPPLALLCCGKIFQAFFNFLVMMTCVGWFLAALWAMLVVAEYYAARRQEESNRLLVDALNRQAQAIAMAAQAQAPKPPRASSPKPPRPRAVAAPEEIVEDDLEIERGSFLAEFAEGCGRFGDRLVGAYRNLPDWAQPISWGLAIGTPLALAFVMGRAYLTR